MRVYFNPIIYVHLLNIYDCLKIESGLDFESKEAEKIRILQIINIFKNSIIIENVQTKMKKETFWHDSLAVLSDTYIYFYHIDHAEKIQSVIDFCRKIK